MQNVAGIIAVALVCFSSVAVAESKRLFDCRSFRGWEGDTRDTWRIEDGAIVGGSLEETVPQNEFLATTREFENFELTLKYKLVGTEGFVNGGVQFRSRRIPDHHEVIGYQADLGMGHDGALYDESRRRRFLARPSTETFDKAFKKEGWNEYRLRAEGPRIRLWLNDVLTVDYVESEPDVFRRGVIALQIHGGCKAIVRYKDISIEELPPTKVADRPAAPWPPAKGPLRMIIDTDAANEIDDQYALVLALGNRDRLKIEGLVAAHFGTRGGGQRGIESSYREIERVLDAAGLSGEIPIKRGVDRLVAGEEPVTSDGVDFIIDRAMASTPEDPLWLVLLGPPTDAVAALVKEPRIADRMIVFWHVRSEWPDKCHNFNAKNDPVATRRVFEIPSRLVLFDTGTHLALSVEESERRYGGLGSLGRLLTETHRAKFPDKPKGIFDLGDVVAFVDPEAVQWERTLAPGVDDELKYDFSRTHGEVVRIYDVDSGRSFNLLERALERMGSRE